MRINHNINAINVYNKFSIANKNKSEAMERISSGLSINSASDNAAGLSISEKMRAQIRGLQKASRNIQDGISLIQTAENGLAQIGNPNLQRMRELCLQAANGTLTEDDRQKIQEEIDQIKNGIDDIANNTEFNSQKVLRPPIIETPPKIVGGQSDIIFIIDKTGSMGIPIANVKANINQFVDKLKENDVDVRIGAVFYGEINDGEAIIKKEITSDVETFKSYIDSISITGGGDFYESGLEGIEDALNYSLRETGTKQFILVTDAPVHDNDNGDGGDGKSEHDIEDIANKLVSKNIKLTIIGRLEGSTESQLKRLSEPTGGEYLNIEGSFSTQLEQLANNIVVESGVTIESDEMPTIDIQVGPNSNEEFSIKLFDARTEKIGIDDIIIDPIEEAQKSIGKVDKAIEKVSSRRAQFGAYQNALGHINNNVLNYKENLTAAESRIKDADIAKEVMEMTKYDILEQSSQALLKQAQDMPNNVLNLINMWGRDS